MCMYVCVCMYVFLYLTEIEDETVLSNLEETKIIWTQYTGITEHKHDIICCDFHFKDVTVKVNK